METALGKTSIDEAFKHYWGMLALRQKESLLTLVKTFVEDDAVMDENFLAEYNKDIDEALDEYERGEHISQEEMEKKYLTH